MTPRFAPYRSSSPKADALVLPDRRRTLAEVHLSHFLAAGGIRSTFEFRREAGSLHGVGGWRAPALTYRDEQALSTFDF